MIAGCGGGGEFNEDALRADLVRRNPDSSMDAINQVVDAQRDMCQGDDREFALTVALVIDENPELLDGLMIACPNRTSDVLAND